MKSKYKDITSYITVSDPSGNIQFTCLLEDEALEIRPYTISFTVYDKGVEIYYADNFPFLAKLNAKLKSKNYCNEGIKDLFIKCAEIGITEKEIRKWYMSLYKRAVKLGMVNG